MLWVDESTRMILYTARGCRFRRTMGLELPYSISTSSKYEAKSGNQLFNDKEFSPVMFHVVDT